MKKPFLKVKDFANLQNIKKKINDALTGEKSQELKDALNSLISELDNSEVEVDETAFAEQVAELIKGYMAKPDAEVPAAVANAIASKMKAIKDSMQNANEKVPLKVKNEITAGIISGSINKLNIKNKVQEILVKNDITGLSFADVVDYEISTKWEDLNPLFAKLKKTFFSKFFYTASDYKTAAIMAKQWDKTSETEKAIQALAATSKTIATKYVYGRQNLEQEDLDDIAEAGQESSFMSWMNKELDQIIINSIIMAILVGDTINSAANRVTTFETIGSKTATDAFTIYQNPETANTVTVKDVRTMVDKLFNPNGKEKWLIMSKSLLTALSAFVYASGGDTHYRTKEEMAGQLGVDYIFETDVLSSNPSLKTVHCIAMIPDGYWYKEKKNISVSWNDYKDNALGFLKERNIGGGIHDLLSTAVLKEAES